MKEILYPRDYIVWDFETSGLDPRKDYPIELGFAVVRDGEISEQYSSLIKVPNLKIPETITNITGITQEMIDADGKPLRATIDELLRHLLADMPHVTHNGLRFDIPFLVKVIFSTSGMDVPFVENAGEMIIKNAIDTAVLFKATKLGRQRRFNESFSEWGMRVMDERVFGLKYNVAACCNDLGIELGQQHRALGDVLLTNEIYKKMCL